MAIEIQANLSEVNSAFCGDRISPPLYRTAMKTLADRVIWARNTVRPKMSQAALADAVGVTQQSVQALEAGEVERPRYLLELAEVLAVPLDWLRKGAGEQPPSNRARGKDSLTPQVDPESAKGGMIMKPESVETARISDRLDDARRAALRDVAWRLLDEMVNEGGAPTPGPTRVRR